MLILALVFLAVLHLMVLIYAYPVVKFLTRPTLETKAHKQIVERKQKRKQINYEAWENVEEYQTTTPSSVRESVTPTRSRGCWTYNPNTYVHICDQNSLRVALSHPGKSFRIQTGHPQPASSPHLNGSALTSVGNHCRWVETETVIVHSSSRFREGSDEGLEIRYVTDRGYSRVGRFYFTPNLNCTYDNFIYKMEEL